MNSSRFVRRLDCRSVLRPEEIFSTRGQNGKAELRGASAAIICFQFLPFDYLRRKFGGRKAAGFTGMVSPLRKTEFRIVAARPNGLGAPGVAVLLEELAASGIKQCAAVGVAATLQEKTNAGDLLLTTRAIRDEGTSNHYLPSDLSPSPSEKLLASLSAILDRRKLTHLEGPIWTTDAPYRETVDEIARYKGEGVLGVDMETSAFLSVCSALDIESVAGLVAADSLAGMTWQPPADNRVVNKSLALLADSAVEALAS